MATNAPSAAPTMSASSASTVAPTPLDLSHFTQCSHTFVATRHKHARRTVSNDTGDSKNVQQRTVPCMCRLRTHDNAMGIYVVADPIDTNMLASEIGVKMFVQQMSTITFENDSYPEKISNIMQKIFFDIENRLLQMTFDHAEDKVTSAPPSSVDTAEKLLPSLEEAESGAFLFAATVTQSNVYIAYVGTIRVFLISNNAGELSVSGSRPQFFGNGSLHTIDNEDERLRLKRLDVDLEKIRNEGLDRKKSKFTRCIGKLSEKLLSSTASANDVNEARCNPLICEPTFHKFKIAPHDYALVMMTDKVYQMYLKTGIPETDILEDFLCLLRQSPQSSNCAQHILDEIENRYYTHVQQQNTPGDVEFQDLGLLIHFFHHPLNANNPPTSPLVFKSAPVRPAEGEVTVNQVEEFVAEYDEIQQKRLEKKQRFQRSTSRHEREEQLHTSTIEPYVKFDMYEQLLNENQDLHNATEFITGLLFNQPASVIDENLAVYLENLPETSSLREE